MRAFLLSLMVAAPIALPAAAQTAGPAAPGTPRARQVDTAMGEVSRNAPVNGVLVLYGNQRCPTNDDGAEVVVCVRRGAEEQFRIPKELREFEVTPQNEAWAVREKSTLAEGSGVNSIGSCSTVGAGGQTGCFVQNARRARADAKARNEAATPDLDPY
jgi:hypothetical protein